MINFYFGYMPIITHNGRITHLTIDEIIRMSGETITEIETVSLIREMNTISEEELEDMIRGAKI